MRPSTTLQGWARREAIVVAVVAVIAAVAALSDPLGLKWLGVAGLVAAALGAALSAFLRVRRATLEGRVERVDAARRFLVPVGDISGVLPTKIGVNPAEPGILPGDELPEYVPRAVDQILRQAIDAALHGGGSWLVVVEGSAKVGMSRTLFEALCACSPDLQFVAPKDGDALRLMLDPGDEADSGGDRRVLWLNDVEPFLAQGVTMQTLGEWRADRQGRIVAATYGGAGVERIAGSPAAGGEVATTGGNVMQHARVITLGPTTPDEVRRLAPRLSPEVVSLVERYGLAAYLVSGEKLTTKLATGVHAAGEPRCPEGVAVVEAALDWARSGRTDRIDETSLRELWSDHLTQTRDNDEGFQAGVEWALRPVAGKIALLSRESGGFRPYNRLIKSVSMATTAASSDHARSLANQTATPELALQLGVSAFAAAQFEAAADAFERACESRVREIAATAGVNLGVTLSQLDRDRHRDAVVAFDDVAARYGADPNPALREQVAMALYNKGVLLTRQDELKKAVAAYDQVLDRYDPSPTLREALANTLVNKGNRLADLDQRADAVPLYDEVIERYGANPGLREQVAHALFNKALRLGELGTEAAVVVCDLIADRYGDDQDRELRVTVAKALRTMGNRLRELDETEAALAAFDQVADRYREDPDPALREQVAMALVSKGNRLWELGKTEAALAAFDQVADRYRDDPDPALREQVAMALVNKSSLLRDLGIDDI